ncbi:unnamed protein product [Rotaria sp. Silwood2]|nr:unnamed protein product [Rotaria sp. Silwood2]CAF4115206.1 unnamed protein product [Rotaria sp. Silwood2]
MTVLNRTVFDFPLTWNRTRFVTTRNKCRFARKLIEISINVQFEKQLRNRFSHNIEIEENINDVNERLLKYHDKLRVLDNMIELASQSLRTYFDKRMENLRVIVKEHCNIIQQIIHEEAEHWKEIHSVMNQNLLNPGDIRSRNNYPQIVQKSPASNIDTIEEEEDKEHVSKLLDSKILTPLLTQMIRKSRLQSKRLTIVPSIKVHIPSDQDNSILRKDGRFSIHILPLSTVRQHLEFVDTTFVVKPEETMVGGVIQHDDYYDESNGTYRAPNQHCRSYLAVTQPETLFIDSQPNIPARLCFTPTILYDRTVSLEDDINEQSSSLSHESNKKTINEIFSSLDQNRTNIRKAIENTHRFGQTFLLDIIKTEQISDDQNKYKRPTIPDDDVLVVTDTNSSVISSEHISHTTNDNSVPKTDPPIQQESTSVQEIVPAKPRRGITTKTKSKPMIISSRKTRSAAKIIAEREAAEAAAAKASLEKQIEKKRKTRKRKQSKSIDRPAETSDDENTTTQSKFTQTITNKRKTKKHKKSKIDYHSHETSDDGNNDDNLLSNNKRKTQRRTKSKGYDHEEELLHDNEKNTRKTKNYKKLKVDYHSHETSDDNDNNDNLTINNRRKTQKRSKSKRYDHEEERLHDNENHTRKTKKTKEQEITDIEHEIITNATKSKKSKPSTIDNEEKQRRRKIKKTKIDDEEQTSKHKRTRSSAKRNHRPI